MCSKHIETINFDYASSTYSSQSFYEKIRESLSRVDWSQYTTILNEARRGIARLLGAKEAEVALLPDTVLALNTVSISIPVSTRDRIILLGDDDPNIIIPWARAIGRGARATVLEGEEGLTLRNWSRSLMTQYC